MYVLEILEAKFRVTDWYWRNESMYPITSRVIKVSKDMTIWGKKSWNFHKDKNKYINFDYSISPNGHSMRALQELENCD